MSETQTESETDAEPTPGPWQADVSHNSQLIFAQTGSGDEHVVTRVNCNALLEGDWKANAKFIAAAGTAAQEAKEMGYDPQEAVEALPQLLYVADRLRRESEAGDASPILCSIAGDAKDALASAEGSGE